MSKKLSKTSMEKRVYPRKTLRIKLVFEDEVGEGFIYFYSTDISLGGIFVESDIPLKIGTQVFLSFQLDEKEPPLRVTASVVRIEKNENSRFPVVGMGVRFSDLTEKTKTRIEEYIMS